MSPIDRRSFIKTSVAASSLITGLPHSSLNAKLIRQPKKKQLYRVSVIGLTGRGGFGHGLERAFQNVAHTQLVSLSDPDRQGRKQLASHLKIVKTYADYRKMLSVEQPDIVCIGPSWVADRTEMVTAAAQAGCHIYCEKPFAGDLESADVMVAAIRQSGVKFAMAHQWRAMPPVQQTIKNVLSNKYGKLLRMRARPKDDSRGGGEELILHGTHMFDLMIAFAGRPQWASGHILDGNVDATQSNKREATEPVGPIVGDSISAMFGFPKGVRGYFESSANLSSRKKRGFDNLYGLFLECEQACLHIRQPGDVFLYPAPMVLPDHTHLKWQKMILKDWHFTPNQRPRRIRNSWLHLGNTFLAKDLINAIKEDGTPLSNDQNALDITEMVQGVYASHFSEGQRISIPLLKRKHPLID